MAPIYTDDLDTLPLPSKPDDVSALGSIDPAQPMGGIKSPPPPSVAPQAPTATPQAQPTPTAAPVATPAPSASEQYKAQKDQFKENDNAIFQKMQTLHTDPRFDQPGWYTGEVSKLDLARQINKQAAKEFDHQHPGGMVAEEHPGIIGHVAGALGKIGQGLESVAPHLYENESERAANSPMGQIKGASEVGLQSAQTGLASAEGQAKGMTKAELEQLKDKEGKEVTIGGQPVMYDRSNPAAGLHVADASGQFKPVPSGQKFDEPTAKPPTPEEDKQRRATDEQLMVTDGLPDNERKWLQGQQRSEKINGLGTDSAIIVGELGPPPVPADFRLGKKDPEYLAQDARWAKAAEEVQNRMASAHAGATAGETESIKAAHNFGYSTGKDGEVTYTTEAAAAAAGQAFEPVSVADVHKDRQTTMLLGNVQLNASNYKKAVDAIPSAIPIDHVDAMNLIINDIPTKSAVLDGATLPEVMPLAIGAEKGAAWNKLSPPERNALTEYFRAEGAVIAYQRALTNQGRTNPEALKIELNAIPSPTVGAAVAAPRFKSFQENLDQVGGILPNNLPGVQSPKSIRERVEGTKAGGEKTPTTVRVGGQDHGVGDKVQTQDGKEHTILEIYPNGKVRLD